MTSQKREFEINVTFSKLGMEAQSNHSSVKERPRKNENSAVREFSARPSNRF
jgi:hypothetical protein